MVHAVQNRCAQRHSGRSLKCGPQRLALSDPDLCNADGVKDATHENADGNARLKMCFSLNLAGGGVSENARNGDGLRQQLCPQTLAIRNIPT
jgi:hypothetical protein